MKKLLFIPIALLFFACPSDDDMPAPTEDPIIGTWKFIAYIENGVEQPLFPCQAENTLIFQADGNLTTTDYIPNASGGCEIDETFNYSWENIGNGNYAFTDEFGTDTEQISFEGNTFYTEDIDDNDTPGDTSDDITERIVFQKQ